jgi:GDP-L-fucose synthase
MKCLVTGGSGLLGKTLKNLLPNYLYLSSKDLDLTDYKETKLFFDSENPDVVIHLAAKVGGIKDNATYPYDFISQNNKINTSVIDWCILNNKKIIFSSSSCVYPTNASEYPLKEHLANTGELERTNDGYGYAKRFAGNLLDSAKKQYSHKSCILYFCNLYGEYDNFLNETKSHLVTALIHKLHKAKINNLENVELMGTGNPLRQFMYANDAANIIKMVVENDIIGQYNAAIDKNLSVKEIANIVKNIIGYKGTIQFNGNLDGIYRKDICSKKIINIIGKYDFVPLEVGVEKTYKKYLEMNYVETNAR